MELFALYGDDIMGMDIWGNNAKNERGEYFRASVWSWRPIHCLICEANERFHLGFNLFKFDINAGAGLKRQRDCKRLAAALETLLAESGTELFTLDSAPFGAEGAVLEMLNRGSLELPGRATIEGSDAVIPTSYAAERSHVEDFIDFLKNCGGFEIW